MFQGVNKGNIGLIWVIEHIWNVAFDEYLRIFSEILQKAMKYCFEISVNNTENVHPGVNLFKVGSTWLIYLKFPKFKNNLISRYRCVYHKALALSFMSEQLYKFLKSIPSHLI